MNRSKYSAVFAIAVILAACGGGGTSPSSKAAPVANAGVTQNVATWATITLDGSASSDANNDPLTYSWSLTSKPTSSTAALSSSSVARPTFTPDVAGIYVATLIVNNGKVNSDASTVTVNATVGKPEPVAAPEPITNSTWTVFASTSSLTGQTTTNLSTGSAGDGSFNIFCSSNGFSGYYLSTKLITNDGQIRYRIGSDAIVSQTWNESPSNGYTTLSPTQFDLTLLQRMYKNRSAVFQYDAYLQGSPNLDMSVSGFSDAIDQTRAACNWSTDLFPPGNGWGQPLPVLPPVDAKEAVYVPGAAEQFRLIAWRALNVSGKQQLLVRLGDKNGPCAGSWLITDDRLRVTQDGKTVDAVSGKDFHISCNSPAIFALNGDFDASRPFTLSSYSTGWLIIAPPNTVMATVSFD